MAVLWYKKYNIQVIFQNKTLQVDANTQTPQKKTNTISSADPKEHFLLLFLLHIPITAVASDYSLATPVASRWCKTGLEPVDTYLVESLG